MPVRPSIDSLLSVWTDSFPCQPSFCTFTPCVYVADWEDACCDRGMAGTSSDFEQTAGDAKEGEGDFSCRAREGVPILTSLLPPFYPSTRTPSTVFILVPVFQFRE